MEEGEGKILSLGFNEISLPLDLSDDHSLDFSEEKQILMRTTHTAREACIVACCKHQMAKVFFLLLFSKVIG